MKRIIVFLAVSISLASVAVLVLSVTDLRDDAVAAASPGATDSTCTLPALGYVTCQREIEKLETQRIEVSVPGTASPVVVRAKAEDRSPGSGRRVEPGQSRILANEGAAGIYRIQARTRLLDFGATNSQLDVEVVD